MYFKSNVPILFNHDQLVAMFKLQARANSVMSDDWTVSTNNEIPYYRAAYVELVEFLDHMRWKWWKKEAPDFAQARMELIDVLHFALSDNLRTFMGPGKSDLEECANEAATFALLPVIDLDPTKPNEYKESPVYFRADAVTGNQVEKEVRLDDVALFTLLESVITSTLVTKTVSIRQLSALFYVMRMTGPDIYNQYVAKNTLNLFRNANGQRTNDYVKVWAGREDNEYVTDYMSSLNGEPVDGDSLVKFLAKTYYDLTGRDAVVEI